MTPAISLRPRERRLVIVAAAVTGCWAVVSIVVQPLWDQGQDLQRRVEVQSQKLQALNGLMAQAPSVERRYHAVTAAFQVMDAEPAGVAQRTLLDELEQISRQTNVILNLKPRPMKPDDRISRFEVELDAEGAQATLLAFLDALLAMNRLLEVERLHLATIPAKTDRLRATVVLHHLTFQ